MTDRDRLIELFEEIEKDPAITCPHYKTDKTCDTCKYTINNFMCNHTERTVDYLLANGVIVPPCKAGDLPDKLFSHNSIIAIWVEIPKEHCSQRLWRGMAWDIPEKYKEMPFKRIFGSIPESIYEADTINILVDLTKEEAEEKLRELNK